MSEFSNKGTKRCDLVNAFFDYSRILRASSTVL